MTMLTDFGTELHKLVATKLEMASHSPFRVTALIQLLLFICAPEADSGDGMKETLGEKSLLQRNKKKGKAPDTKHLFSLPNCPWKVTLRLISGYRMREWKTY